MINVMEIDGYQAVVQYDSEIGMFRGEFIGLNGGADFYAATVEGLRSEGKKSLKVFLDMCAKTGWSREGSLPGGSISGYRPSCTRGSPFWPRRPEKA